MPRTIRALRAIAAGALIAASLTAAPLPAGAAAEAGCLYDRGTHTLILWYAGGVGESHTIARKPGSTKIEFAGATCSNRRRTVVATAMNTDTIELTTGAGAQTFVIDLSNGPFMPGISAEHHGTSEIEFRVNLGGGLDTFQVDGSVNDERITFRGATKVLLNGDRDPDVTLRHTETFAVNGNGGDDRIRATRAAPEVAFHGGTGADTLIGGGGRDALFGDKGNDTLTGGQARDEVSGGAGGDVLHLKDSRADTATCGGGSDDASDRDVVDAPLTGCEVT
jgi:Ca2+-binding RTX toxin-like protein